ncbi:MAG TPA: hypothetical protein VF841_06765 [Anaeromyxobacter sp.]
MSRLASVLAVALVALRAAPARAEPLDLDLVRLGAPDASVWTALDQNQATPIPLDGATARSLANDAKRRFAILSSEMALALSSPILDPASTTGHAGFDFAAEGAYEPVHSGAIGGAALGFGTSPWPTVSTPPGSITTTGIHVRKALPWSFEFGGRLTYLNKSNYFAAQGEAKWALNEGFEHVPDLAIRVAYTRLFGQSQWNLGSTDVDFMVSKRWGVSAVTSFTPYLAARFTFVDASSERLDFGPARLNPASAQPGIQETYAAFPDLRVGLYRTTLGVRMTASSVSMAFEGTYFGGKSSGAGNDYPSFKVASALGCALKFGWEF